MNNRNTELGYFEYKKNKMNSQGYIDPNKFKSRFGFMFKLFIATFIVIFIILVITIMKFSSRVDIEYSRSESPYQAQDEELSDSSDDERMKIDNRLMLIQQEEHAPSEAKILNSEKNKNQVMDISLLEENERFEQKQRLEEKKAMQKELMSPEKKPSQIQSLLQLKEVNLEKPKPKEIQQEDNFAITSKVVVGRYPTSEDAKNALEDIKTRTPELTPFVRKLGDVYAIQMGSYKDFAVARSVAQSLKVKGFDVWIYQQ